MPFKLNSPERVAQLLAVICLTMLILLSGKPEFTNASVPVRGIRDPGIALQMARNVEEVDAILGPAPSADREAMRLKQYLDFAFIVAYVALAIAMAVSMKRMRLLAFALLLCVIAASIFDGMENLAILRLLPLDLSATTPSAIDAIRRASVAKWYMTGFALALLSIFFFQSRRWYLRALGALDLAAGALAAWGVAHNEWLPPSAGLLSLGLLLSAATLNRLTHESAS